MIQTVLALTIVAGAVTWLVHGAVRRAIDSKGTGCGACSGGSASGRSTCPACPADGRDRTPRPRGLLQIADR